MSSWWRRLTGRDTRGARTKGKTESDEHRTREAEAHVETLCGVRTALGAEDRVTLRNAADWLEARGRYHQAARAFDSLGDQDALVRVWTAAGEYERVEQLLHEAHARDASAAKTAALLATYDGAMKSGDRLRAWEALQHAARLTRADATIADLVRRFEARRTADHRITLSVAGERWVVIGQDVAVLGRADAECVVRGASVSRRHAEVRREVRDGEESWLLRDLGSRNGTLVHGVPLANELVLEVGRSLPVGLGEDATLSVVARADGVSVEVVRGMNVGSKFLIGKRFQLPGVRAELAFREGLAVLVPAPGVAMRLAEVTCAVDAVLLVGDVVDVSGVRIEVLA